MGVPEDLIEILACPETKAPVVLEGNWIVSTDPETRRRYPVKDDIPIMLIEEAETMGEEEWRTVMKKHGKLSD